MSSEKIRVKGAKPRRRQARGERRVEQLLKAAGEVFAKVGYESATTNGIAAAAGVSPGTLYQFFSNKEEIAEALAAEYAEKLALANQWAFEPAVAKLPLPKMLDRIVDTFLDFHDSAVAFQALFVGSGVSLGTASRVESLREAVQEQLEQILRARKPNLSAVRIRTIAFTCVQIFKAFLPATATVDAVEQKRVTKELKIVLQCYLKSIVA